MNQPGICFDFAAAHSIKSKQEVLTFFWDKSNKIPNELDPKILKYIIKIIKNCTLPNHLACAKPSSKNWCLQGGKAR